MKLSLSSLKSREYQEQKRLDTEWANLIKERDKWCCCICGSNFHPNAHHIIPRENKDFRYALDNGVTLCTKHHKFSRIISAHNNPLAFIIWLMNFRPKDYYVAFERQKIILKQELIEIGIQY